MTNWLQANPFGELQPGEARWHWSMPSTAPLPFKRNRPVNPNKLTQAQQRVLEKVDGMKMGFVSNAPLYDDNARALGAKDQKIMISLLLGGALHIIRVPGSLPGEHRASRVGAHGDSHLELRRAV